MTDCFFHIVLYRPEIPYNTGNIIRLCANIGAELHLIRPLGFNLSESKLKRAALDYSDLTVVTEHDSLNEYINQYPSRRLFGTSSWNDTNYTDPSYRPGDTFIFGPESCGLPDDIMKTIHQSRRLTIPMAPGNRCMNLSNSVAVVVYEAWRQVGFTDSIKRDK